jgi:G patch domain-containing protein 1
MKDSKVLRHNSINQSNKYLNSNIRHFLDENLFKTKHPIYISDEIPSKKPINVEDQIVLDSNGKRRFHGAFTGGFAAGFWNTVGSAEGFKPQQFKSSRFEKAQNVKQNAADFMDEEDKGEFGFAPEQIKTKPDFGPSVEGPSKANKRKLYKSFDSGPIPGVPVLESLMKPANDKAAVRILKHMGWKEGQGVGARMTRVEKKRAKVQNQKELYVLKKYGCDMGPMSTTTQQPEDDSDSGSDLSEYEITFAPDDFDPFVVTLKENTFGIGYSGLDRNPVLSKAQHVNLFAPFEIHDNKNNKKLSIRGQAFGVGALEEEDEDIYARDDMTRYDFSLEDGKKKAKPKAIKAKADTNIIDGFCVPEKGNKKQGKKVFYINMPDNFQPRNWAVRKSRFEPLDGRRAKIFEDENRYKRLGLGRHDLTPEERGKLINEAPSAPTTETVASTSKEPPINPILDLILQKSNQFVVGETLNLEDDTEVRMTKNLEKEKEKLKAEAQKITTKSAAPKVPPTEIFKPFVYNEDKQMRYEKFLTFEGTSVDAIDKFLTENQPLSMTDWERKFERQEFTQAKKMYKPLDGLMLDR